MVPPPDNKYFPTTTTPSTRGRNALPPDRYRPQGVETPTPLVDIWLAVGLVEPTLGESCPSGQRGGPVEPGDDKVPPPDNKSFHKPITPTTRGRKRTYPGLIPPRKVWKPKPNGQFMIGWGLWTQRTARVVPRDNGEVLLASGDDKLPSLENKTFYTCTTNCNQPGRKTDTPRVDTAPHCGNLDSTGRL